jgi:hypothetical protein
MSLFVVYWIADLFLVLVYWRMFKDPLTVVHHSVIIVAFLLGIYHSVGTFYMGGFLINEVSTLFVNANFFFAASDKWRNHRCTKQTASLC